MIIRVMCSSTLVMKYAYDIHEMLRDYSDNPITVNVQPKLPIKQIVDTNYYDLGIIIAPGIDHIIFDDKEVMMAFGYVYTGIRFHKSVIDLNLKKGTGGPILPNTKHCISIHIDDSKPLEVDAEREICDAIVKMMRRLYHMEGSKL